MAERVPITPADRAQPAGYPRSGWTGFAGTARHFNGGKQWRPAIVGDDHGPTRAAPVALRLPGVPTRPAAGDRDAARRPRRARRLPHRRRQVALLPVARA